MRQTRILGLIAVVAWAIACNEAEFKLGDASLDVEADGGSGDGALPDADTQHMGTSNDAGVMSPGEDASVGPGGDDAGSEGTDAEEIPPCLEGQVRCGAECVDLGVDDRHCGACDASCSGGTICLAGTCEASSEANGVLQATNMWRASGADCGTYGVKAPTGPLVLDPDLSEAAQAHAVDMVTNNFFDHTGSDNSNFSERVARTAYTGFAIGENIAAGGNEAAGVVQRWVDSDGHCRNLMNPNAKHLGAGFQVGGPYGTMWVQVFGQ